jgi:hypothetical protein
MAERGWCAHQSGRGWLLRGANTRCEGLKTERAMRGFSSWRQTAAWWRGLGRRQARNGGDHSSMMGRSSGHGNEEPRGGGWMLWR